MTKKIKWRLGTLPTPEEVTVLFNQNLLTKEEAREILFSEVDEQTRDAKSLESEIKFLRDLVERLSKNPTKVIETIRTIEKPYREYTWYQPYMHWCNNSIAAGSTLSYQNSATAGVSNAAIDSVMYTAAGGSAIYTTTSGGTSATAGFNTIKTF